MKQVTAILLALATVLASTACNEALTVGQLRCMGDDTECAEHDVVPLEIFVSDTRDAAQELELEGLWSARIPDGNAVDAVVHADGSITVASTVSRDGLRGTLLLRYAADGELLALDDTLVRPRPEPENGIGERLSFAALALNDRDTALLAEQWVGGDSSFELTVYFVDDRAAPHRLFTDPDSTLLEGFEVARNSGHIFVSGPVIGTASTPLGTEVTRYVSSGEIIYRQSALDETFPSGGSRNGPVANQEHWMAVDSHGHAYVLTQAAGDGEVGLVALDPDGNVSWHGSLDIVPVAQIALGPESRPFVVGGSDSVSGLQSDGYALYRVDGDNPLGRDSQLALSARRPDDGFDRFSLTVDSDGRALVLAETETEEHGWRSTIERYSADFSEREVLLWPTGLDGWPQTLLPVDDREIVFWSSNHVGKVALP